MQIYDTVKKQKAKTQPPQFYNPANSILNPGWAMLHNKLLVVPLDHASCNTVLRPNKRLK